LRDKKVASANDGTQKSHYGDEHGIDMQPQTLRDKTEALQRNQTDDNRRGDNSERKKGGGIDEEAGSACVEWKRGHPEKIEGGQKQMSLSRGVGSHKADVNRKKDDVDGDALQPETAFATQDGIDKKESRVGEPDVARTSLRSYVDASWRPSLYRVHGFAESVTRQALR
jgi:hypothetical protein